MEVFKMVFSLNGQLIAPSDKDKVITWDVSTGTCRSTIASPGSRFAPLDFSPDSQLIASASENDDNTVRLWDVVTGACCNTLKGHSHMIEGDIFSPDGQLIASASLDRTVRVWETTEKPYSVIESHSGSVLEGHSKAVSLAAFLPDG